MIGNELWDRTIFGTVMIAIGAVFAWLIWEKSLLLAAVGIINMLFGAYVIWGAFAWESYRREVHKQHKKKPAE